MTLLRRFIFILFSIIFLTCAPILVMYALGYLFKTGEAPGLVKTGLIYITTVPRDAQVFLDQESAGYKTPATVRDLLPGNYQVKVVQTGYLPWIKTVSVVSGKASVFDKVILVPEKINPVSLHSQSWQALIVAPGNAWFLLTRGNLAGDLYLYHMGDEKISPLIPDDPKLQSFAVEKIFRVPGSDQILLQIKAGGFFEYYLIEVQRPLERKNLTPLFLERPERVEWASEPSDYLYSYQNQTLNKIDVKAATVSPRFMTGVTGYGIDSKYVYAISEGRQMIRAHEDGKNKDVLVEDEQLVASLFEPREFTKISMVSKNLILFLGTRGKLVANRLPYSFVPEGVLGYDFDPQSKRVLLWTQKRIGAIDFMPSHEQEIFEKAPQIEWIYENGRNIEQVYWVYEDSYALFRDGDEVYLLEAGSAIQSRDIHRITSCKKNTAIYYRDSTGLLYFLDEKSGRLSSIAVVPQSEMSFLSLPDFEQKNLSVEISQE